MRERGKSGLREGWKVGERERRKNVDRGWSGTEPKEVGEKGMRDRGKEGGKEGRMWIGNGAGRG